MADKRLSIKEIQLSGKLITNSDPCLIAENFQTLTNMRYVVGPVPHIKSIAGMTKINSNIIDSTYYKVRSGLQFKKELSSERHILVQAFNTDLSASRIYDNKTSVPSTGEFETTALYVPDSDGNEGRWSLAPDGDIAYCNGKESCIYGGEEREISAFINYDPYGTFSYDQTDKVRNTLTDSQNVAVLNRSPAGIDSHVVLLLHLDNNVTDSSPTTPHTITNHNVTFNSSDYVFGGYSGEFNGSTAYLSAPDDADFNFKDGTWAIDTRVKVDSLSNNQPLYYQQTDSERYFSFYINTAGAVVLKIYNNPTTTWTVNTAKTVGNAVIPTTSNGYFYECTVAGTTDSVNEPTWPTTVDETVVDGTVTWACRKIIDETMSTASGVISTGTWYHVEVDEDGDDWFIFVDGSLKASMSLTDRLIDYSDLVQIGYDGTNYLDGKLDEYRISDTARHRSPFELPTTAYSQSSETVLLYLGAVRPIDGFKFTIETANTAGSSMTVWYFDGTSWTQVSSLSDGTKSGGVSLAQTGSVTFDSTESTAKIKYIDSVLVYWYRIRIGNVSSNTSISHVTVSCPFQTIKDIWDGNPRVVDSFQKYDGSTYNDLTLSVREDTYPVSSSDTQNMAQVGGLPTNGYLVIGFVEQQTAIGFKIVSGHGNAEHGTIATLSYWDGAQWVQVDADDGTFESADSLAKSGVFSWSAPTLQNEYTQAIINDAQLYYYKINFSITLGWDVQIYYIYGIPAQKAIAPYKFPLFAQDRLFLCCNENEKKNSILCSNSQTSIVFNGDDSITIEFGDEGELIAGSWLYSQFGSTVYNLIVFLKKNETWALIGNAPDNWVKYRISAGVGCTAPHTAVVCDMASIKTPEGLGKAILIWQGADGIYLSDGRTPILISDDISDVFDKNSPTAINPAMQSKSTGFFDRENIEYHWQYADGTSTVLNKEKVFSLRKMAWFDIDRTANKRLQYGLEIISDDGATYTYGFIDTGYMLRLEYGTSFDGESITSTFQLGDIALAKGSITKETMAEFHGLIALAKSVTTNSLTITHYGDGLITGNSWTESPQKSGRRLIFPVRHEDLGAHLFHSWKYSMITDNELVGFEPLFVSVMYSFVRDHRRDWR